MIKGFNRPFKWYFLPRKRPKSTIAISLDLTFLSSELDFPPNFLFLHVADLKDNYSDGYGSGSNHSTSEAAKILLTTDFLPKIRLRSHHIQLGIAQNLNESENAQNKVQLIFFKRFYKYIGSTMY